MQPHRNDIELAADLQALRPTPGSAFVAELDARAAAGFPRKARGSSSAIDRFAARLRRVPRRRLPALAGAAATASIAVATAVVAISEGGPTTVTDPRQEQPAAVRFSHPRAATAAEQNARPQNSAAGAVESLSRSVPPSASGPYASRATRRDIERSARIVLGTEASEVRSAAARVFETVHSYDGIVMRSSVRDGSEGEAGAVFDLQIPSGRLGDAMAAFSGIAEVRSRSESTLEVTAPTIGLEERLRDAQATVAGLLAQLAAADTDEERAAVETKLRAERRRLAALRSRLTTLQRRTHLSRVSLRIETGAAAAAGDPGDRWGVDEALDEAGRILIVAAGVTLIGLAIIAPLALICLLIRLVRRRQLRLSRERALG
jgi:uncharacterized protein DUF4349